MKAAIVLFVLMVLSLSYYAVNSGHTSWGQLLFFALLGGFVVLLGKGLLEAWRSRQPEEGAVQE